MKNRAVFMIISSVLLIMSSSSVSFCDTVTQGGTMDAYTFTTLSIELDTQYSTFGSNPLYWTSLSGGENFVRATAHNSSKSDINLICKYNGTAPRWCVKMSFTSINGLEGKMKFYLSQPTYNSQPTTGTLGYPTPTAGQDWPVIPATPTTIYTSGNDKTNSDYGTWCGISFALDARGLGAGISYGGVITYTIVESA